MSLPFLSLILFDTVKTLFTFANLHKAYVDCRHNKGATLNHLRFRERLEGNLLRLEEQLQTRTYKPGQSIAFVVTNPKVREIFAAGFDDRVVHHSFHKRYTPRIVPPNHEKTLKSTDNQSKNPTTRVRFLLW